jgi:nucleoside phosphorylase
MGRNLDYEDYSIAWLAVLPIEAEAALGMLDKQHQGRFESVRGDDYIYIGGEINGHNVVVATWPAGQNYGVGSAAALVNQVKARFTNIWFALLVGVAAGLPNLSPIPPATRRDIRLGDVLVCTPEKASTGIIHYDLGKDTAEEFLLNGRQAETPALVRAAIGNIQLTKKRPFKTGHEFATYLAAFQNDVDDEKFRCPSQEEDRLYDENTRTLLSPPTLVEREPRDESERTRVWYGNIGSGSSMMRNAQRRDELRDKYDLIGLEMEAAGIMNTLPTGVIRGVCDYGDSQKNKDWQPYAAAVAAVYAKGILYTISPKAGRTPKG